MTSGIEQSLRAIESSLGRLSRHKLLGALAPGLTPLDVRAQLARAGLASNADVEAFYQWHNGTADDPSLTLADLWMFPIFYPLSLEEAIAYRAELIQYGRWDEWWIPVFADGSGDFMAVDLSESGHGRVFNFDNEFAEAPLKYESLSDMMATMAAAFERGIFFVDDRTNAIWQDVVEFNQLAAAMNPDIEWWNDPALE